ncbi:hypothetical protein TWF751_001608 [Orbilia oligospora]|nr:hypothetical protein TWF751_001608 [Orbilia oligospora]
MNSEGQDASTPLQQQAPPRPASPPKERSQTPKILTPVVGTPDITSVASVASIPSIPSVPETHPTKRRSLSPMPPSAHSDTFPNPFNAPFHTHSLPTSMGSHSAPPEGPTICLDPHSKLQQHQPLPLNPRPYTNNKTGFKVQSSGLKLGSDRKPSPDDGNLFESMFSKEDDKKRTQSISKSVRKGSRAGGDSHRRTSSGGLTTIPYIPKGFRNIVSNEPAQTPLMQAIHNPISLDTGPSTTSTFTPSSIQRLNSPHQGGPPKLGLNTQFGSRTGSPEPGSSATPTTAASPGSPMGRRRSRADGDKPPGSAKGRARQRSLLPKSTSIQFESVPYPYPNSESSVFVQVSPRASTTSLQFQPPLVPYQPQPPPPPQQHHQHQLPPPHHGSPPPPPPPPGPSGAPAHNIFMSPIGPPPPPPHSSHFGPHPPPPPPAYSHFGIHQSISHPHSPGAQHQGLPPPAPPHRPLPPGGSGNPFSSNGAHPPPEFRPIDYGHPRGHGPHPPLPGHGYSPIMSSMTPHSDGLRKALFPQHDRSGDSRKSSITRTTPFSGAPSTFMEDVTSPTTASFNSSHNTLFERRDQPIVAPKSPTPPILQQQQHQPPPPPPPPPQGPIEPPSRQFMLGPPLNFTPGSAYPTQLAPFHSHSSSSAPSFPQQQQLSYPPQSLPSTSTSPNKELSSFLPQPTTPTMPRRKGSDKSKQAPRAASTASASTTSANQQRVSVGNKSQPPPSPQAGAAKGETSIAGKDHPPPSPATPMIKRRSAYVAGGGIKTTDLALPKPDVVELTAPPPDQPLGAPVDTEQMLMINKPRKRNKANPSVLRTREKEVDDAMTAAIEDLDGQPGREVYETDIRSEEPEERIKETSREAEPTKLRQKRARRSKMELSDDDEDEYMDDGEVPSPPATKKPRRSRFTKSAPSVVSEETATEEEQQAPLVLGKRARKASTRAIKAAEQSTKRRRTRKTEADEAGTQTDYISASSATESVAPEPPVEKKPPVRRGRKPRAKDDKEKEKEKDKEKEVGKEKDKEPAVDETTSEGESTGEQAYTQLIVNGKPIRIPSPPPSFKKPGLVGWYRCRERPKFTEGDEHLDGEHTLRRLNDWFRLHHYRTSQPYFKTTSLIDEDGWTDTEQDLEKMGRSKPTDAKAQKTILWDSKISDAAFEKGFEQLERKGSVEPLSAADTPKNDFPPEPATVNKQPTALSRVENAKDDGDVTDIAIDETVLSTAVATPMADLEGEHFSSKEKTQEATEPATNFVKPTHSFGFDTMRGAVPPKQDVYNHTERKRKNKTPFVEDSARNLKGVKWIVPHIEGRPAEILKQTWDWQTEKRKIKEKAEAEAAALAALEDPNGEKPKKRGGRRGKKKTKGDLKNLAYAREVRRAKLEGAKIHTPDEDNLSVASDFLVGDGGEISEATIDDDDSENSDHVSDWSADEEEPETPADIEMERILQETLADPAKKAFIEEWVPRLYPNLYELPNNETRNRGPEYADPDELGAAIDMAIEIDDQELLQSVMTHTMMQYAMVADEKTRLDSYQVKRGFLKPETVLRRAGKRKADDAGFDDGDDGPGPRYSTRRRTVKNPDADDQIGMTGYSTPRVAGSGSFNDAQTPEREVRAYKPRGGRGGRGGGARGAAKVVKTEMPVSVNPVTGLPTSGPGSRGGRGRGGSVRGSRGGRGGRGRQVT